MFVSSIKGVNRLISKWMSNIYLKVTVQKKWCSQNCDLLSLKNLSPGHLLGSSNSRGCHWILKTSWSKTLCGFSTILILNIIMTSC